MRRPRKPPKSERPPDMNMMGGQIIGKFQCGRPTRLWFASSLGPVHRSDVRPSMTASKVRPTGGMGTFPTDRFLAANYPYLLFRI
jgi:hypothetical protein